MSTKSCNTARTPDQASASRCDSMLRQPLSPQPAPAELQASIFSPPSELAFEDFLRWTTRGLTRSLLPHSSGGLTTPPAILVASVF
eukprot:929512-Amorphochlora_amoeboformis.AAC.1